MKRLVVFLVFAYLFLMPCWSVAYRDSYVEMDIPDELEIQSEAWDEFIDNFRTSSGDMISYHLVLQQKGLNDFEMEAFDRYCRVIITAVDTGITGYSNKDFQNEIATSTLEELGEMLDNFEKMFLGSGELVERYETSSVNFDGKYALHMSLLRKSFAGGRSDVHLEGYVFVVNGQMFFITASYRTDAENLYAPVIEKMIPSIKILIEDGTDVDGSLYEQTIPWVDSVKFLWPRENIEWKTTAEDGATSKSADFSDIYHLGLTCNLTVVNSDIAVNKAGQSESLQYMKDSLVSKIKNMFKGYNIVITRNTISDGKAYIDYTYSADGVSAYDSMYIRFADTRRIVMFTVERLAYNNPVFNNIVESLGF